MIEVEVARRFTLNGTIDGHDPLGCTFKVTHAASVFWLTVITVNWGRGYNPGEFKRNVLNVLEHVDGREYVVLLIQELDEADEAPEHQVFRKAMEPGTTLVEWWTREPIAVSPGVPVRHQYKVMTMDQGSAIGAPKGTGPRRFFTSCIAIIEGVRIGFGNQHPHRVDRHWSKADQRVVSRARKRGERITKEAVRDLVLLCDLVIHGGDMNDLNYPKSHPKEQVANERGLDTIRWIKA